MDHFALDQDQTLISTLDELIQESDNSERPEKVFVAHNLGYRTFLALIPMKDFFSISKVANDRQTDGTPATQRPLDEKHATELAKYILKGLLTSAIAYRSQQKMAPSRVLERLLHDLGPQSYVALQPIVTNLRECAFGGNNLKAQMLKSKDDETIAFKVFLRQQDLLYVIDGQHRRYAMELVFEFLRELRQNRKYPKRPKLLPNQEKEILTNEAIAAWDECDNVARSFCRIAVEIHLGLNPDQERQLFHDLNNFGKKVAKSLALQFDTSNPVGRFMQIELVPEILGWNNILDSDITDWHQDTGQWTFKDLAAVNAILFLNKTNIGSATPAEVDSKLDVARRFWSAISQIEGFGKEGARSTTVAAQPVVIKALSKLVYDFAFGRSSDAKSNAYCEILINRIPDFDFSHENPCWRYYEFSQQERSDNGIEGLSDYLPLDKSGQNRDIGGFDKTNRWMRFGAKHNDIYPVLADMIRWQLKLPSRR